MALDHIGRFHRNKVIVIQVLLALIESFHREADGG